MTKEDLILRHLYIAKIESDKKARLVPAIMKDDLLSYAYFGLINAAEKFDKEKGYKFSTFANRMIIGYMLDGIKKMNNLSRYHKIEQLKGNLIYRKIYLDRDAPNQDGTMHDVFCKDDIFSLNEPEEEKEERELLLKAINNLKDEKKKAIVKMYIYEEKNLKEIANELNITKQGVHNHLKIATDMIKKHIKLNYN